MGPPTGDTPGAPEVLRTCEDDDGETSTAASDTRAATAAESSVNAIAANTEAGESGAASAVALAPEDPPVKACSDAPAQLMADIPTDESATERENTLAPQEDTLTVNADAAPGADGKADKHSLKNVLLREGRSEPRVVSDSAADACLREGKPLTAQGPRDNAEISALTAKAAEGQPAAPTVSEDVSLSCASTSEAQEPKDNHAASTAASQRHVVAARQRRNTGRQRGLAGVGKAETDGAHCEDPAASTSCAMVVTSGSASTSTRSGGSSVANATKREQGKVRKRYEPLLRDTEDALHKVTAQGLPEAETLTHPQIYLDLKKTILLEESSLSGEDSTNAGGGEDGETCKGAEGESGSVGPSRVKRLLRALCEGSTLPLSKLTEAVCTILADETDGAPRETVSPATLQSLIPVLLARRSLGIPPRRGLTGAIAGYSPADTKLSLSPVETECGTAVVSAATRAAGAIGDAVAATGAKASSSASTLEPSSASDSRAFSCKDTSESSSGDSLTARIAAATTADAAVTVADSPAVGEPGICTVFSGSVGGFDRNEDTTASCLWVWECAFLDGLPAAFKEKAKRDRERRAAISRRVRSLLRLQQAIEQGNEKEILTAQEKVAALEKKQQQDEERRREQQLKKRRAEEARLEKEREKKQKEDAKREREKEKKKSEDQQKQAHQQSAGGGGGAARSQTPAAARTEKGGPAQKEKKKELPPSMLNQQLLMASWLTRKPLFPHAEKSSRNMLSGLNASSESKSSCPAASVRWSSTAETRSDSSATDSGVKADACEQRASATEGEDSMGSTEGASKRRQAACSNSHSPPNLMDGDCFPWEKTRSKEFYADEVVEVGEDPERQKKLLERKAKEAARARAATEAALWKVPEGKRHQFVERVLTLPKALVPLPSSSDAHIPFFDDPEDPTASGCCEPEEYLKAFVESCAAPHHAAWRDFYSFFAMNRQYIYRLPPGGGVMQSQHSSNGGNGEGATHSYCQEVREVRKGLALTDYADASLPDLQYLRTVVVNLDEWKRPVRRLLLGKRAAQSTAWEQCAEESCIDYDRDSDEEWFETFDVDDLDDAREEEEEEDLEADEDKDWLVDDDEDVVGLKSGHLLPSHGVRFESLCDWQWTFEGEDKPNHNDVPDACALPTLRDPGWLSIYGCVVDDWGGEPFAVLKATTTTTRRKLTDEDLCGFFRFCHGKIASKVKLLAHFHKENRHLRKSELEKKFKEHMEYERRPQDKQKRWYVSCRAAEALNLKEELDAVLEATRDEEALREAAQPPFLDSPEEPAADTAAAALQASQPDSYSREAGQATGNANGSPEGALDEGHRLAREGIIESAPLGGRDDASFSDTEFGSKGGSGSPRLLASSLAEDKIVSSPSSTDPDSLQDEGTFRVGGVQNEKSSDGVSCRIAAADGAFLDVKDPPPESGFFLTNDTISERTALNVETLRKEDADCSWIEANTPKVEEAGKLQESKGAQVVECGSPTAAERIDAVDVVEPFASAALTAAHAASCARAAAAAAYEQRPAEFASATCVAMAALTAAKLANEVALQISGSLHNSKIVDVIFSSPRELFPAIASSDMAAPDLPSAHDHISALHRPQLEENTLSPRPQESSHGVAHAATGACLESAARDQVALAAPVEALPATGGSARCQQYSANENASGCVLDADDADSNSTKVRKRRRSDGSLRNCYAPADALVATNKRAKRPSCPGGTPGHSAGSQLKNALITKFFRVVSHAPKRVSNDASDEVS